MELVQDTHQRVLMIGWEYPPQNSGGLGVACQGLTEALSSQDTEIYFTLPYHLQQQVSHMKVIDCYDEKWLENDPNKPPFSAYSSVIDLDKLKTKKPLDSHQLRTLPQSDMEQKVEQYSDLVAENTATHKDEFDVIHAHDWMSYPAGVKLKQKTGKPLITHVHSTEQDRTPDGYGSPYIEATEKEGMEQADKVVAVSFYTKRLLTNYYQIDPRKIEVVHNGIIPLSYQPKKEKHFAQERPVIAFMGRLTNQKGGYYFVKLARQVLARMPQALFIVAGSGHLYHQLLLQSAQDNLTAHVLFSGFVRDKQKRELLERADVFVMPSLSEPFGLVALEAAQHKTPVIVSKNSGVSEVMTSAIKTDFWDIDKMTEQIVALVKDKALSQELVKAQLQDINQATWFRSAQEMKYLYRQAFLGD